MNTCSQNYKFTGKERDSESNLDNFGARYYASTTGRFMTPDWALKPASVPYASFGDPQKLNLYAYVENSPLDRIDADGHANEIASSTPNNCATATGNGPCTEVSGGQAISDKNSNVHDALPAQDQKAQQQSNPTAAVSGKSVTYTYPDGSKVTLSGTHPFRDNNPGDLRSGHGLIGRDGGFAIYPSLDAGVNALGLELKAKAMRGRRVLITGILHRADTMGEITPIYMDVAELQPVQAPPKP